LLKVLEGENKDALEAQQKLITEKALPDLDDNIKCGNSIIGTVGLNNTDIQRFNAFEWDEEFSEIKKNGGFDAVIGNPPYVRQEKIKEIKPYLKDHYETYTGVADLYVYFFERGLKLLKEGGMFSYICSNKFTRAKYGTNLRKFILKYNLKQYIDYTGKNVFEDATVDPCVTIIKKEERGNNGTVLINDEFEIPQNRLNELGWILKPIEILDLNEKIIAQGKKIKDIKNLKFYRGILTGYNKAFIIDENIKKDLISKDPKNSEIIKPMIMGRNIKKWEIDFKNNYLIFTRRGIDINKYPVIKEYLIAFKEKLTPRNEGQKVGRKPGDYKWYEIQDTISYYKEFEREKLIYPVITSSLFAVFDKNKFYLNDKCFMIASDDLNLKFLNALLASKTLNFVFKLLGSPLGKSGIELRKIYVEQLPIYPATPEEQKPLIELADQMLQLHEDIKTARTPQEKKSIERQISATDKQVDNLVYELYGMTEDEIKIVEDFLE